MATIYRLSDAEAALRGFTHVAKLTAAGDFAAGDTGTTKTIQIYPLTDGNTFPAGTLIKNVTMNLVTTFDSTGDAAINSVLVEVGDGTDPNRFLGQTQAAADGSYVSYDTGAATTTPYVYAAADTLDIKFTVAGGASPTIAELNSGEVHIYFHAQDLNGLDEVV